VLLLDNDMVFQPRARKPGRRKRNQDAAALAPETAHSKRRGPLWFDEYWYAALEKAKVKDFRFHDLRHTAASYLAMSGATVPEIAAVLGHRTLQMVKRYAHLSDQHTGAVVERMTRKYFKA
ncbi:MAG: tyrosine-type recombinase/integrase, partial [Candidatus Acidiferrales bacterium]